MAASGNISMFLKNVRLLLKRYQCATAFERKCAAAFEHMLYVCGCFWKHFNVFFNERAGASEKDINT